jgi:hypothetical protein
MTQQWPTEVIPLDKVIEYEENPNEMTDDMFSALVEEIAESGWLVPIQVAGPEEDGTYRLIGGHHRKKAALVLGIEEVPAVVVDPEVFDRDRQEIQVVKQNVLHGELNPEKFTALFNKLSAKYDADMLRSMMAFTKTDAFNKVYLDAKKGLPPEMQEKLEEVRDELKTIDDLSLVLNRLFTDYGSTVKFHAMFFSYGGREHLMVQLNAPAAWTRVKAFTKWCVDNKLMVDEEIMTRMDWPADLR